MNRLLAVLLGVVSVIGSTLSAGRAPNGEDDPKASERKNDEFENSLGMKFVLVRAGSFMMGSAEGKGDADERPARRVTISKDYWLGKYEVSQAEYVRTMGESPSWFRPDGPGGKHVRGVDAGRLPVEMVSWREADDFCHRLSDLPAEKAARRRYRLPTEAEWEFACRAGTTTEFSTGDELLSNDANCKFDDALEPVTRVVGSFAPNAYGLFDMHGNVWEWCADRYDSDYYREAPATDPPGPATGTGRVVRGGDYRFGPEYARCANRDLTRESRRDLGNGLRVVLQLDE